MQSVALQSDPICNLPKQVLVEEGKSLGPQKTPAKNTKKNGASTLNAEELQSCSFLVVQRPDTGLLASLWEVHHMCVAAQSVCVLQCSQYVYCSAVSMCVAVQSNMCVAVQ